jgi:hypothetical protein
MRATCLYCEEDGVETDLVLIGRWGCCPIHSARFIAEATALPEGYALVRKPELTDRGIPR